MRAWLPRPCGPKDARIGLVKPQNQLFDPQQGAGRSDPIAREAIKCPGLVRCLNGLRPQSTRQMATNAPGSGAKPPAKTGTKCGGLRAVLLSGLGRAFD